MSRFVTSRVRLHALMMVAATSLILSGCDEKKSDTPAANGSAPAATPTADAKQAGVIVGTGTTQDGRPIKSFSGSVSGYNSKSGERVSTNFDGADGKYKCNVGPGQFALRAWTDVEYEGHKYRIDLCPKDNKGLLFKHDTTDGLVKDFVWKLDGFRPGADERTDDRYYSHFGGSVMLYGEGRGAQYHADVLNDYSAKPQEAIPADATIEVTLTPDGPLIDGSTGKAIVIKNNPADVKYYMDRCTRGIPIGKYNVTGRIITGGVAKPARVVVYEGHPGKAAPAPAASAPLLFIQKDAPSDNVNKVNELNILVLN
jgi:hypothetical protein